MNTNNNQTQNSVEQCCVDYCRTTYNVAGREVINNYKCDQHSFTSANLYRIRRNKKEASIRTNI